MARHTQSRPALRMGANLFHHVDRIYDFYPAWIESRWNRESVERDLSILRSLGAGMVRYHIHPIDPEIDRYPGAKPEDYRALVPHALACARRLGLATHIDLHSNDFEHVRIEDVLARLNELGPENIDTLQIINEFFYLWKKPANLDKLEAILTAVQNSGFKGQLCFDAGGSVHRRIARSHPHLAKFVKHMLPVHHYTYGRDWDDLGVATFLDILTGKSSIAPNRLPQEARDYHKNMMREHFSGLADEIQVLEVNSVGFPFWNAETQPNRGGRWREIMRRLAAETNVSTVCHFCFRDKISWREYGFAHSGLLYACEAPKSESVEFREAAFELMPAGDIYASFRVDLGMTEERRLRVIVSNRTNRSQTGKVLYGTNRPKSIELRPRGKAVLEFHLPEKDRSSRAIRHHFAEFQSDSSSGKGTCLGWHAEICKQNPVLRPRVRFPADGISYVGGLSRLAKFFRDNQNRLALIVENPATAEMEMAVRLQDAMGEAWGIFPDIYSIRHGIGPALREKACIFVGYPDENDLSRLARQLIPAECIPKKSECILSAHPHLWQQKSQGLPNLSHHWMRAAGDVALSPGAALIWANSFDALRRGVFDLVQRIRSPQKNAEECQGANDHEAWAGLPLSEPRRFALSLPAGEYLVAVIAGTRFDHEKYSTFCRIPGSPTDRVLSTRHSTRRWVRKVSHHGGFLAVSFEPTAGRKACPAVLKVSDASTEASVFKVYFHPRMRADLDYDNYHLVGENDWLNTSQKLTNWMEVRAQTNEETVPTRKYGWIQN